MGRIVEARVLAPDVKLFRIDAPKIARKHQAGQFVIVRVSQDGERIPLTIADSDPDAGLVTLVVQAVGRTTAALNRLEVGDRIPDIAGPLGTPTRVALFGTVAVVGGGVGIAVTYPAAVALSRAGNTVIAIIGARNEAHLIFRSNLAAVCEEVQICTDDGSAGRHGFVTGALADLLTTRTIDRVLAAGPIPMMAAVAETTRPANIPTEASLNPIMVDGTGMCGGCRVAVGGVNRFACLDGPDFDAHQVDFGLLARRNQAYASWEAEQAAADRVCAAMPLGFDGAGS